MLCSCITVEIESARCLLQLKIQVVMLLICPDSCCWCCPSEPQLVNFEVSVIHLQPQLVNVEVGVFHLKEISVVYLRVRLVDFEVGVVHPQAQLALFCRCPSALVHL